jgi:HlyD family secretion protein
VTYTVVISTANPDLGLLPGMTANVRIVTAQKDKVLKVPNAALRFRPADGGDEKKSAAAVSPAPTSAAAAPKGAGAGRGGGGGGGGAGVAGNGREGSGSSAMTARQRPSTCASASPTAA